jgi:hypothetical protein
LKGTEGGYGRLNGVDPDENVHDFKTRWMSDEQMSGVRPSRVTLQLAKRGPGVPDKSEEAQAVTLEPRLTLRDSGVADGSALLAKVAGACSGGACVQRTACS